MGTDSTIRALNTAYLEAMMRGDTGWFERHLAAEFVCIESDGRLRTRGEFLRKIAAGPSFTSYRLDELRVRSYGVVAVVRGAGRFSHADGTVAVCRYSDTYVYRGEAWLVVSAQVTAVRLDGEAA